MLQGRPRSFSTVVSSRVMRQVISGRWWLGTKCRKYLVIILKMDAVPKDLTGCAAIIIMSSTTTFLQITLGNGDLLVAFLPRTIKTETDYAIVVPFSKPARLHR